MNKPSAVLRAPLTCTSALSKAMANEALDVTVLRGVSL